MALWRLYYHLIWATKERSPLITFERETQLYSYIIGKANTLGSIIHAVGGIRKPYPFSGFYSTETFYL
ncbi:transposase [Nostoc sp.]|uniref:transposase n=1 Tax=uncultured Nostoc sp. TaxID=340711 RepID=UPI002FF971D9